VYADNLTEEGIRSALRAGRTYAAQHGARLVEMTPMPGEHVEVDRMVIRATVQLPKPASSPKEFMVYRDGVLVRESRQTRPGGAAIYEYEWTDVNSSAGEHRYVFRVGEVLLTSAALVRVSATSQTTAVGEERERPLPKGRICFVRDGDLWATAADGSKQRRLTQDAGVLHVTWSPGTQELLYSSEVTPMPPWRLMGIRCDGAGKREIAELGVPSFSVSDYGTAICFDRDHEAVSIDLNSERQRRLGIGRFDGFVTSGFVTCTRDGRLAAIYVGGNRLGGLGVWDVQSGKERFNASGVMAAASLSPNGERVAFVSISNDGAHFLKLTSLADDETRVLARTDFHTGAHHLVWAPASSEFAWAVGSAVECVSPATGGRKVVFARPQLNALPLDWSPDGRYLLCHLTNDSYAGGVYYTKGTHQVWKVDLESGDTVLLADNAEDAVWCAPSEDRPALAAVKPGGRH